MMLEREFRFRHGGIVLPLLDCGCSVRKISDGWGVADFDYESADAVERIIECFDEAAMINAMCLEQCELRREQRSVSAESDNTQGDVSG